MAEFIKLVKACAQKGNEQYLDEGLGDCYVDAQGEDGDVILAEHDFSDLVKCKIQIVCIVGERCYSEEIAGWRDVNGVMWAEEEVYFSATT